MRITTWRILTRIITAVSRSISGLPLPLALHGVIVRRDGTSVNVCVGEDPDDPVFCVTDLLPHLATEQMKRTMVEGVKGEDLNILIGSRPFRDDEGSELVKLNILKILPREIRHCGERFSFRGAGGGTGFPVPGRGL